MVENINPLLEKCELFSDMQVWPIEPPIKPELWLSNFREDELPFAESLLSSFFLYNEKMCNEMLKSTFQNISSTFGDGTFDEKTDKWNSLCSDAIFTTVDIDDSNLTASGNFFCRKAKQVLGIEEGRFHNKEVALAKLYAGSASTVIFLDDFIGSGLQFTDTWTSPHIDRGVTMSYAHICASKGVNAYYINLLATEYGLMELGRTCKNIEVVCAHTLNNHYSALAPDSIIWPDSQRADSQSFLEQVSIRSGLTKKMNWKGFHDLGLTVAFAHGVPDATLPIFYWNENGWKPLIERR